MKSTCDFCGKPMPCPMFYAGKMCCPTCWDAIRGEINKKKKGETTMQVEYNGFTGELFKFERRSRFHEPSIYDLEIFEIEKKVTHSFYGVKLEDVKFLGGEVIFG